MKRSIISILPISILLIIGTTVYFQTQSERETQFEEESEKDYQERIKNEAELIKNNLGVFGDISNKLKESGFEIISSNGIQQTREQGGELLIEVPKTEENNKQQITKIANSVLKESAISKLNLSVKIIVVDNLK